MKFDKAAAKAAGWSDEEIAAEIARGEAEAPKGLLKGPIARGVAQKALGSLPGAGAAAGGVLAAIPGAAAGGIGALPASVVGAGVGGAGGHVLADIGSNFLLGEPYSDPLAELAQTGGEGLTQAALQAIGGRIFGVPGQTGAVAQTARAGAGALRDRAEKLAVQRTRTLRRAGDIRPEIEEMARETGLKRKLAGQALGDVLQQTPAQITIKDIADDIAEMQAASFGSSMDKKRLAAAVRDRLREVLPEHTTGAVPGNRLVWDLPTAHRAQQAFDQLSRGKFSQMERGVTPKPALDTMIASAFRGRLAAADPAIAPLKGQARDAIRTHQDVLREVKRSRSEPVEALRSLREERLAAAAARLPGGMPTPTLGIRGPEFRSPAMADALDILGNVFANPRVSGSLSQTPRLLDTLLQEAQMNQLRQLLGTGEQ